MNMLKKAILVFLILIPLTTLTHYIVFPQETRCILLPFYSFEKNENLYYKKNSQADKIRLLKSKKEISEKKDSLFWKQNTIIDYKLIYCNDSAGFSKYAPSQVPAATYMKMGAYIVIKDESLDENIIAHELSHTILYRNIGWYKRTFVIPTWFDEGLAMQVDDRDYYSIDSLLAKQRAGLTLPDVTQLKKASDFFSGDTETIMLNYATAKYIVFEWLKTHSLQKFIEAINNGQDFEKAYGQQ